VKILSRKLPIEPSQNPCPKIFTLLDFPFFATTPTQQMSVKQILKVKTNYKSPIAGFIALASLVTVLACPSSVFALGFALPDQDAFATARGNAFIATADDPAAVYYNPAGITQLNGTHASLGAYGIVYGDTYKGAAGEVNSKTQLGVLPQFFSSLSLPYDFTFGMGTYSPYGLRMEWPATAPFVGTGETGEMDYTTLNPVIAYKINSSLSIAAGPTLNYSEAYFKQYPGFVTEFRGRDTAAGFSAGVLWQPWEQHSFGLTYHSATDMNYNGHATSLTTPGNIPSQANIHFPQTVGFGYSYRPTTNWNIEADANWADWTDLRTVSVNPQGALGYGAAYNWHPSWMLDLGATRKLGHGWRLSGGFMFSEGSVPEADFTPLIPDSNRYIFSVGVGKDYKQFSWDVAFQEIWGPPQSIGIDNSPTVNGSYEFVSHAISINVGYHF
jgi:long-chain fatty acid transport protein